MKRYLTRNKMSSPEYRAGRLLSETPYIVWSDENQHWKVQIHKPMDGYPKVTKTFWLGKYEWSNSKALKAARKFRDENIHPDLLEGIKQHERKVAEEMKKQEKGPKYKPTIVSQFQLWHTPRKQQP